MWGRIFRRKAKSRRPPGKSWWRRAFSTDRLLGLAILAGFLVLYVSNPYPIEFARSKIFDVYQQLKPRPIPEPAKKPVTIIDLDERSLAEVGQWPWPRTTVAQLVHNLTQMGALLVAFDVFFAEPDRLNPADIAKSLRGLDEETQKKLAALPSNDAFFADVIKRSRVVLGQTGYSEDREVKAGPPVKKSVALRALTPGAPEPKRLVYRFPDMVRNVAEIEKVAAGHGMVTIVPERDGIVRRVQMLFNYNDDLYPSLSLEMLRVTFNRPTLLVEYDEAGIRAIGVAARNQFPPDGLKIVTDRNSQVYPYFSKSDKAKYVRAADVLKGTVDQALIKGKLTIVGTSAEGLKDIKTTPTESAMPGVEVHAQLIEAALTGAYLTRPNYANAVELGLILAGGLLMIVLVPWIGAKWTLILFVAVAGGAIGTSWYQFAEYRMLYDAGFATVAILLLYTFLTYTGYAKEEAQRRQVRSAFSHYLSPAMVETLANDPTKLKLGGEARDMSMLFCDVRGFTTISEMFDAEGLTKLINKLLTPLTKVILDRNGTVDKYMGDCIMAFWNAPLDDEQHARNACISALEMNAVMGPLNERLAAEAAQEGHKLIPLKVGIGVNSGRVVVGNMGSDMRFDYSILGDNVNLASRLEGQCKTYHVDTVIGENTQKLVPDLAAIEIDLIRVKGKKEAVRIYTLLGDEKVKEGNAFKVLNGIHGEVLAAYRGQDWTAAKEKIAACRQLVDGFHLGEFYDMYAERIAEFEAHPPPKDWDGVYVATSK